MSLLAKVHIAKKQLGLDDDTYRDVVEAVTGKTSAKLCSTRELEALVDHFISKGFRPKGKLFTGKASKHAAKIHALWISGWNLGVIRDNSDKAMERFIFRQTQIAKAQWLTSSKDAIKVIEALKSWLEREAKVRWDAYKSEPQQAVISAQWNRLAELGADVTSAPFSTLIETQQALGKMIRQAQAISKIAASSKVKLTGITFGTEEVQ